MIRGLFRLLSALVLAVAAVAAVLDAAQSVAASRIITTPLGDILAVSGIMDIPSSQDDAARYDVTLGNIFDIIVLQCPVWVILGLIALLLYMVGYRRAKRFESH